MKLILMTTLALAPLAVAPLLAMDKEEPAKRLNEAAAVFSEVMDAPDKGIPQELLEAFTDDAELARRPVVVGDLVDL